jgi:hypothetical protein
MKIPAAVLAFALFAAPAANAAEIRVMISGERARGADGL